jgi:hypothetical protein
VSEGGGVAHEEENIEVIEMPFDEAYAMIESKCRMLRLLFYCNMPKLTVSYNE